MGRFLYSMTYYLAHSTANSFVVKTGAHTNTAHSASIIGADSAGALISSNLQRRSMSLKSEKGAPSSSGLQYFRRAFLQCCIFPIIGNIVHAIAVSTGRNVFRLPYFEFGRFILGFGSADSLHRQLRTRYCRSAYLLRILSMNPPISFIRIFLVLQLVLSEVGSWLCRMLKSKEQL